MPYKKTIFTFALASIILDSAIVQAELLRVDKVQLESEKNANTFISDAESNVSEEAVQQQKIQARLNEIKAEKNAEKKTIKGYYVERKSYGTARQTEPPSYVKQANKTWLKDDDAFADIDWLDIGLDYRFRYENHDNDFRKNRDSINEPILLRTRGFVAIKNILDPLRLTLEVEDARRNHSQFTREFDTGEINYAEPIQAFAELYFKETPLGKDDLGNDRTISVRAGRQAFEYTDRRLIARNEWRNTTNNFQGVRTIIGQSKNDWQLDLLALKPVQRLNNKLDEVNHSQNFYGVIGDWRRWSEYATLQPYYYLLKQEGDEVEYDSNGATTTANAKIDREIHTAGIRAYGVVGNTGWDYDANYTKQWGHQDRLSNSGTFIDELDHDAYAYNAEIGYSFNHPWKPRLSAFYGFASGDNNPNDSKNQRFERLFGAGRPWSNNSYFQIENIATPKVRVEFEPPLAWLHGLKVDTGYSWYRLDSATDRWNGASLRDNTGQSGKDVGEGLEIRARFPITKYIGANVGYAEFWAGDFTKATSQQIDPQRREDSNFFYTEISVSAF